MDKSLLLSGEQLLELKCRYQEEKKMRRKKRRFNRNNPPIKREELPSSQFEKQTIEKQVDSELETRFKFLGSGRVKSSHDMGLAEWCPQSKSSKVIITKKRSPWMGFMKNNQLMYTPEETVFLMEAECILVKYLEAQLSLQSAYQMILADNQLGKRYRFYSYLTQFGYRLKSSHLNMENRSLPGTNINLDKKSILDVIDKKLNQSRTIPIASSSNSNLILKTFPLRREMFLNGTSFDKTATWSEYKRLTQLRANSSEIFDEETTVLELNDEIRSTENIFDKLPNKSLIDPSNNLKPLIDQTKVTNINRLHQIMKEAGPQERNLHKFLQPSKSQPEISYQLFKPTVEKFSSVQPDHQLVICFDPYPPMIQESMSISGDCGQSTPIYATISHSELIFNTLEPFDLWDEIPTFWDSSIK